MIDSKFAKWATGFSGCNGGNLKGNFWLCGIEHGGGDSEESLIFNDVSVPKFVDAPHWKDRKDFLKSQYNLKAVKLLAALAGREVSDYCCFFREKRCFDQDSEYFKLNLYPIGFKNTSQPWPDWLKDKTGFATRQEYLEWCFSNRFPKLRGWVQRYSPQLVLCTGKTYAALFQSAFGSGDETVSTKKIAGKQVKYFVTNNGSTMVAIVYFLGGWYGLKSDAELSKTGEGLRKILQLDSS